VIVVMARRGPTRAERTALAFEIAGHRGLARPELTRIAGKRFGEVLQQLERDGYRINVKDLSRYDGKPWRWTGWPPVFDDAPQPESPAPPVVPQLRLPVLKPTDDGGER
jgi:hypothetical protein